MALLCTKYLWKEGRKRRRKGMRELKLREGRNLRAKNRMLYHMDSEGCIGW